MTRLAAAAVALALLALFALPLAGGGAASSTAEAAECVWKRQTKRIVKHVRRDGKVRRVVRKRHRWACRAVPQAPVPIAPPAPVAPPPAPAPAPEPEPEANRLSVRASEFYFVLSRPEVRAGALTIELNNQGEDPHDLNLRAEGDEGPPLQIPETGSLQRSTAQFELPAGEYRLWCSLPEHDGKGMHATLLVD